MIAVDISRSLDPVLLARDCGVEPDPWQAELLRTMPRRALLMCSRQSGKSTATALVALHAALYQAPALVLLISPSQRQSGELFRTVVGFHGRLEGAPGLTAESALRAELANGSRIVALPGSEKTIRGFAGADLLILDEAARVDDELLAAVRPMLATKRESRLIGLTTPFGRRGWFYETWQAPNDWMKIRITAEECPRISAQFLEDERREMGEWQFRQEYLCEFVDTEEQFFASAIIDAALTREVEPLWT